MVSACLLALLIYLISRFQIVVAPLVLGLILAYVLAPVAAFIQRRARVGRGLATLLTYIAVLGILSLGPALVVPVLVDQLAGLNLDFQEVGRAAQAALDRMMVFGGRPLDATPLVEQMVQTFRGAIEPLLGQTLGIAVEVISSFVWVIFIVVVSFYLVKDAPRLAAWAGGLPPRPYREDFALLAREIGVVWSAFLRGQLVLAMVVAIILTVVGLLVGLPYAVAMGALAGLLEFLPSVGHGIWLLVASLLMLFEGSNWLPLPNWACTLLLIGLHVVFQQVDLNYLIPRIIGSRVRLHPLVVILGIVAGAAMAGVLGIVLAAPTIASARVVGRYLFAQLLDMDPFEGIPSVEPGNGQAGQA